MKLLLKQYLASLTERGELDVILPDILSETGFTVVSRPGRGTAQYGVDVVATGPHPKTGDNAVYLLSIKSGDLGRVDWDNGKQALRPSLVDILDVYIPKFLPPHLKGMPVVIALCFGGDIREDVRLRVVSFLEKHTEHGRIEFDEWNGDRIAEMISGGLLRENIFPHAFKSAFRKTVAMVDEPSVCIGHFRSLLRQLVDGCPKNSAGRLRTARQIYLATWTVFVWCRDASNLEAAYEASALATLTLWDLCKGKSGRTKDARAISETVEKSIRLSREIGMAFIETHVLPYASTRDGLAYSVPSNASVDINLKLFELLGRVALQGLWHLQLGPRLDGEEAEKNDATLSDLHNLIGRMLEYNQVLSTPLRDDHAIEIMLVGLFLMHRGDPHLLSRWLNEVCSASIFGHRSNGLYPCAFREYAELAYHPRNVDGYREEATVGSILYPSLAIWASLLNDEAMYARIAEFQATSMKHSTWQLWVPDAATEGNLYRNSDIHGAAWNDIKVAQSPGPLVEQLVNEVNASVELAKLSAVARGQWPIVLMACRLYRLPIPPHFWFAEPYAAGRET